MQLISGVQESRVEEIVLVEGETGIALNPTVGLERTCHAGGGGTEASVDHGIEPKWMRNERLSAGFNLEDHEFLAYPPALFFGCIKTLVISGLLFASPLWAREVVRTIEHIKPSIVGVGTVQSTRSPPVNILGTGFVVDDGVHIITSAHVVPEVLDTRNKESYTVITGKGKEPELRAATIVAIDKEHDLALLKISGAALPAMEIGDASKVREGQTLIFTGFPIGMILGFYPVTHRAMVSSITPIVLPARNSRQLSAKQIGQLQRSAYAVLQLDGTAYPGSSGSPLYDPETGLVYGVVNMVFVKGKKEAALSNPSGITYAIPGNYILELLRRKNQNDEKLNAFP